MITRTWAERLAVLVTGNEIDVFRRYLPLLHDMTICFLGSYKSVMITDVRLPSKTKTNSVWSMSGVILRAMPRFWYASPRPVAITTWIGRYNDWEYEEIHQR